MILQHIKTPLNYTGETVGPAAVDVINLVVFVKGYSLQAVCQRSIEHSNTLEASNKSQMR